MTTSTPIPSLLNSQNIDSYSYEMRTLLIFLQALDLLNSSGILISKSELESKHWYINFDDGMTDSLNFLVKNGYVEICICKGPNFES